ACSWIESTQRITLRWWQRLAITRQLEHDEQGQLVWRVVVESAPRRAGKSVRLRGVALWRLEHGAELFGEPQLVVHTGKDVAIVREIQ
ncbi:HNH endonuclease, partial [Sutterella massiliensis]